jgi:hypothetical protein
MTPPALPATSPLFIAGLPSTTGTDLFLTIDSTTKEVRQSNTIVTVTGATSAIANAAAVTALVPVGGMYKWDDGSSIHMMFVK